MPNQSAEDGEGNLVLLGYVTLDFGQVSETKVH